MLRDHRHRLSRQKTDSAYNRRIVPKRPVSMGLHKLVKYIFHIIAGLRTLHFPNRLHLVPGILGTALGRLLPQDFAGHKMKIRTGQKLRILPLPTLMSLHQKINGLFQILPFHHAVDDPMLHQKLRRLKSFGKLLAYGLADHPGPRKSYQGSRLRHNHIAQHGKAGGNAARSGICQYCGVQQTCLAVPLNGRRGLRHLHQGYDPLLHPGSAGTAKQKYRKPFLCGPLYGRSNFLSHCLTHTGHEKPGITDSKHNTLAKDLTPAHRHGLVQPRLFPGLSQLFLIALKIQRIAHRRIRKPGLEGMGVRYHADAVVNLHTKIPAALIADIFSPDHSLPIHRPAALWAADQVSLPLLSRILT